MTERRKPPQTVPRTLSKEEMAIWHHIAEQITPIKKKPRREEEPPKLIKAKRPARPAEDQTPFALPVHKGNPPKDKIDQNMLARIKDGRQRPEGRIDLHGMTEDQAYIHLKSALALAYENNARVVLVITGKGKGGEGLLKRRVPYWLDDDCAALITAYQTALQKDGGAGALYVTLRRK
ncbi:MAG: Smr/MutS family protein [Rickettsiales bacterium]